MEFAELVETTRKFRKARLYAICVVVGVLMGGYVGIAFMPAAIKWRAWKVFTLGKVTKDSRYKDAVLESKYGPRTDGITIEKVMSTVAEIREWSRQIQRVGLGLLIITIAGVFVPPFFIGSIAVFVIISVTDSIKRKNFKKLPGYREAMERIKLGDLAAIKSNLESENSKKCPSCAEMVKIEAIKCRYCGEIFAI